MGEGFDTFGYSSQTHPHAQYGCNVETPRTGIAVALGLKGATDRSRTLFTVVGAKKQDTANPRDALPFGPLVCLVGALAHRSQKAMHPHRCITALKAVLASSPESK